MDRINQLISIYQKLNHFGKHLNLNLVSYSEGEIEYELTISKEHLATPKAAHGGVVAAIMDGVLGVAALTISAKDLKLVSTVEFKINYLSPAFFGDVLIGRGKVIKQGKRIMVCEGEIFEKTSNRLIAKAIGTFNAYPYQKAGIEDLNANWDLR